ncbi:MAG: polysaccharide deacetylase family protein [Planctomycetota bacterium]
MTYASLSLDFDNKWAYLRAAGRSDWDSSESYLPLVAERILDLLGELELPLTTFVVGRDLRADDDLRAVASFRGLRQCEFSNHSTNHLPWMHTLTESEIRDEIKTTHDRMIQLLDQKPVGFRGPGFSCPVEVLRVLCDLDYLYDASIFPTSIAPIARAAFLARTKLKGKEKEQAKKLYGGFASLLQPNRPFLRSVDAARLWEVPVTVMPLSRLPIHLSYLTFLASFSGLMAKAYFRAALRLCHVTRTAPSLLLHPPDFLGREDDREMAYFPGMKMKRRDKLRFVRWALGYYSKSFPVVTMIDQLKKLDPTISVDGLEMSRPGLRNVSRRRRPQDSSNPVSQGV